MAPKKNYNSDQMSEALKDVERGVPVAIAAKLHNVPRTTLLYKSTGKSPKICTMGPPSILNTDEENILVQWILQLSERHFPVTKHQLLDSVEKIIREAKRPNPFKNNRTGDKWFKAFLRRHSEISQRVYQNLTAARNCVTEQQIRNWFAEVKEYLVSRNLLEVAGSPDRVFNADESAFYLQPKGDKVLTRKGEKNVYAFGNDEKECITVLVTANAEGTLAPPMIVFTYTRVPGYISSSIPESWGIGNSENGWMCSATFYEYITNIFEPWLSEKNIPRPVLFFVDGHVSHLTLHLSNFCVEKQIELISLFPNSTHLLQPMDVSVFRPLKNAWKLEVQQWRLHNAGNRLQKQNFGTVFQTALKHITKDTIVNGFRVSGLCPFNVENVQFSKMSKNVRSLQQKTTDVNSDVTISPKKLLRGLEDKIGEEKKITFENFFYSGSAWNGPKEDSSLYDVWKSIKSDIEPEINSRDNEVERLDISFISVEHPLHRTPPLNQNSQNIEKNSENASFEASITDLYPPEFQSQHTPIKDDATSDTSALKPDVQTYCNKENFNQVQATKSNQNKLALNVPTPFKKALFWPEEQPSTKKRKLKEKIPSAITSEAWRRYHIKKQNEKQNKIEEKERRAKLREQKKIKQELNKKVESETSEEEWVESGDSLDDIDMFGDDGMDEFCEIADASDISVGDYLLVKFLGGKRKTVSYRYVCVVQNIVNSPKDIEVMSMKALNNEKTLFKSCEDDISSITDKDILGKLPPPNIIASGDRLKYQFTKPINVFEA